MAVTGWPSSINSNKTISSNKSMRTRCRKEIMTTRQSVVVKSILTLLRTVRIAAQSAITTSEEYFKGAGVVLMTDNFKTQFLDLEVPAAGEAELAVRRLKEASVGAPILAELEEKAEIEVSQFRAFLAENRKGEWFVSYLRGRNGKLWAVDACWLGGGWGVDAYLIEYPGWHGARQVLSR